MIVITPQREARSRMRSINDEYDHPIQMDGIGEENIEHKQKSLLSPPSRRTFAQLEAIAMKQMTPLRIPIEKVTPLKESIHELLSDPFSSSDDDDDDDENENKNHDHNKQQQQVSSVTKLQRIFDQIKARTPTVKTLFFDSVTEPAPLVRRVGSKTPSPTSNIQTRTRAAATAASVSPITTTTRKRKATSTSSSSTLRVPASVPVRRTQRIRHSHVDPTTSTSTSTSTSATTSTSMNIAPPPSLAPSTCTSTSTSPVGKRTRGASKKKENVPASEPTAKRRKTGASSTAALRRSATRSGRRAFKTLF